MAQKITLQEAFDRAWQAFVVEKKPPSYDPETGCCRYRGPNGEACAIGLCISDRMAKELDKCSATTVGSLEAWNRLQRVFAVGTPLGDLEELQQCHDGAAWMKGVRKFRKMVKLNLKEFAKERGLAIPKAKGAR